MPDHDVLRRMYQLLEQSEPNFETIFDHIDWAHAADQDRPRCGIALLKFMGHLGLALREQGEVRVSVVKAIELMMWCQGNLAYLTIDGSDRRPWIVSTPQWMKLVGFPVEIELPNPLPNFGISRGLLDAFDNLAGEGFDWP